MKVDESLSNVAIIILNYNSPHLTINVVNHLLKFNTNLKVVVVDNNSNDNSKELFELYLKNRTSVFLVYNDVNLGYAHGNNCGIIYSQKVLGVDIVGIMNPDVVVNVDVIKNLSDILVKDDGLGLVTAETYYNGEYHIPNECAWEMPSLGQLMFFCTIFGYLYKNSFARLGFAFNPQSYYSPEYYEGKKLAYVDVVQGCFFMARIDFLMAINMLDSNTFLYYEENILAAKVRDIGKKNGVLTQNYIKHNHHIKDQKLLKKQNKIFDIACLHNSRDYFIDKYSNFNKFKKILLRNFLELDFKFRKMGINLIYKD